MSFFDFFFPEQAQASHLRAIASQGEQSTFAAHRERIRSAQQRRLEAARERNSEKRIEQLEGDLAQAGLVIEALIELLDESGAVSRESLAQRVNKIDARDGLEDGRITPGANQPFEPTREWPGGGASD